MALLVSKLRPSLGSAHRAVGDPSDVLEAAVEKRAVLNDDGTDNRLLRNLADNVIYGCEGASPDFAADGDHHGWTFDVAVRESRLTDCAGVPGDYSEPYHFAVKVV
jgi:hypothetical protein